MCLIFVGKENFLTMKIPRSTVVTIMHHNYVATGDTVQCSISLISSLKLILIIAKLDITIIIIIILATTAERGTEYSFIVVSIS